MSAKFEAVTPSPEVTNVMLQGLREMLVPHRSYVLDALQILNGEPLDDNLFAGWIYSARIAPDVAVAALVGSKNPDISFNGLTVGPKMVAARRAIEQVEEQIEGIYEVRFLNIPDLLTSSLWLRAVGDVERDRIVPFNSPLRSIRMNVSYFAKEFLESVTPDAKQVLELSNPPG